MAATLRTAYWNQDTVSLILMFQWKKGPTQGSFLDCFICILRCFPLAATIMGGSGNVRTNISFRNMPRSSLAQQRCSEFQPPQAPIRVDDDEGDGGHG